MSGVHLVTGGAGYFGTLLVERLVAAGESVRIFDVNDVASRIAGVEVVRGDVRDLDAVRRACRNVEVVHNNVAMVPLAKDRKAFVSVNRDGTRNVLQAAREARVSKLVHMSSSAVYGAPERNPVDDATPLRPREAYGAAKLEAERACESFVSRGLDVTIVRPRTIIGHGRLGIMQILFEWLRTGKNVPVLGRGDNVYQFVHGGDLATACLAAAARKGPATYNVGASRFGTMRETLEGLASHAGTGSRVVSVPMAPAVAMMRAASLVGASPLGAYHALMYGRSMYFDLTKVERDLGFRPQYGNAEMFRESYDWYCAHRAEVMARRSASHHQSPVRQGVLRFVAEALALAPTPRAPAGGGRPR